VDSARLGPLTVSRLALGAMLMGDKTPVEESHRMLDRFVDAGGTLVDTADLRQRHVRARARAVARPPPR
jgi:aryl-alcohol dehydrogenase-like predicted oxidoreductase